VTFAVFVKPPKFVSRNCVGNSRYCGFYISDIFIPFFSCLGIALYLGYEWMASLFLGTIFMSSSIAIIIPSLEKNNLIHSRLGKTILGATVVEDVLSLIDNTFRHNQQTTRAKGKTS